MDKLPETLQIIYDSDWLSKNVIVIIEVPSEKIQKLKPDQKQSQLKNHNTENQPIRYINITENTNKGDVTT